MKIVVLNGSPKGEFSVSYQYVKYWESVESGNVFITFHIGKLIRQIEKDEKLYRNIISEVESADFVLWVYPVYTFLVPFQIMRFIEIIKERGSHKVFRNKFTSQISTSHHFYDHTAYNYLKLVCEDWGMNNIAGHLAGAMDLLDKHGVKRFNDFLKEILWMIEHYKSYNKNNLILNTKNPLKKIVSIITDCRESDINLKKMIQIYQDHANFEIQILNLNNIDLKTGCLSCLNCTIRGECVIKDDFREAFVKYVINSDAIIYAGALEYHWFRSVWKKFDDRQFSNGHRISLAGRPVGYLISGKLSAESNIKEIIEARAEVGHVYLLDIITDEGIWEIAETRIKTMAEKTSWAMEQKPERPVNFQGVGGMRVFRDLIYTMRGLMREDHKFYKKNKLYNFPHLQKKAIIQGYFFGFLMKSKKIQRKILPGLIQGMIKPYQKVIADAVIEHRNGSKN